MNDKAIRDILIAYLQATNHEIRIYQEKSIGSSICDVMAVTDKLTGYEIKATMIIILGWENRLRPMIDFLMKTI